MTRMLPNGINPETSSGAEKKLFPIIHRSLDNNWFALHSLPLLPTNTGNPWTEIDFVLVGPKGVFCLEVKGGRVSRMDGLWSFTDRHGNVTTKTTGPFEQVVKAHFELREYLRSNMGANSMPLTGFGVMTPDVTLRPLPPEATQEIVYDENDFASKDGFRLYIDRLSKYWSDKFPTARELSAGKIAEIVNLLRGDLEFRTSLSLTISKVDEEIVQLTDQQKSALAGMRDNKRIVVRGGAGTGKTTCAIEEASRLANSGSKVLLCCFNRRLAHSLRRNIPSSDKLVITNIHQLMSDMIRRAGLEHQISNKDSFDDYPDLALKAAEILDEQGCYDSLIIDESQDVLTQDFLDVLSYLLKDGVELGTWRIFIDPNQDIFHGLDLSLLETLEELSTSAKFTLSINCRNTRQISYATGILSDQGRDAGQSVDGPDVDHIWYDGPSDARRQISRTIGQYISDGVKHTQIAILSDRLRANSCLAQGLDEIPFRLVEPNADELPGDNQIGYYTVQSFKGLEAEVIILIDLENICTAIAFSNNYVGASRARTKLTIALQAAERESYELLAKRFGERMAGIELTPMSFA